MSKRKYPMVVVDWEDACFNSGYYDSDKADKGKAHVPMICKSVGFLLKHDKKRIVLAGEYFQEDNDLRRIDTIPRGMVRKITKLKEAEMK